MRTQPWNRPVAWGVIVTFVAGSVRPALAHNESQHQLMTDYAYNLVLAMSQVPQPVGAPPNLLLSELMGALADKPEMAEFFSAAAAGVPKLRNLRTGLHEDPKPCLDPTLAAIVDTSGDSVPDWPTVLNTPLFEQPMSAAIYPVTPFYFYKNGTCEVGGGYQAPGGTRFINQPVGATARERLISTDHTGMTLGYWAAHVDHQLNDWVLRSTVLETLQTPVVSTGAAAGTAALVSLACVLACGIFPPSCAVCPYLAYEAGDTVYDAIMSIDGSQMMSEDYVGLGHFAT